MEFVEVTENNLPKPYKMVFVIDGGLPHLAHMAVNVEGSDKPEWVSTEKSYRLRDVTHICEIVYPKEFAEPQVGDIVEIKNQAKYPLKKSDENYYAVVTHIDEVRGSCKLDRKLREKDEWSLAYIQIAR